jgi:hypothetical protein
LFICKDVLKILLRYLQQFIIEKLRRSYEDYEKRKNNVLIRDFYEFIGCCNNIDKIITDYITFYGLIEVQLGEKTKATELRLPTRYEIIGGIKQTLINVAKTNDIMLSLVRLALEFVTSEEVGIKIRQRLKENGTYTNIKDIIFTKEMTSYELFDIMKDMRLYTEDDKYVIERIYEWGSKSIHQGQIIPISLIWYCLLYVDEDLRRMLRNQSELQFPENKELYERLLKDGKLTNIYDYQTYIPSYYNKS